MMLSYRQAAAEASISERQIQREIEKGRLAVVHITDRRRGILRSDFEAWLLSRRRGVTISTKAA